MEIRSETAILHSEGTLPVGPVTKASDHDAAAAVDRYIQSFQTLKGELGELLLALKSSPDLAEVFSHGEFRPGDASGMPPAGMDPGGLPPVPKGGDDQKTIEKLLAMDWSHCSLDQVMEGLSRILAFAGAHPAWAKGQQAALLAAFSALTRQLEALAGQGGITPEKLLEITRSLKQSETLLERLYPSGGPMNPQHRPDEVIALLKTLTRVTESAVAEYLKGIAEQIGTMRFEQAILLLQEAMAMIDKFRGAGIAEWKLGTALKPFFKEVLAVLGEAAEKKLAEFANLGSMEKKYLNDLLAHLKEMIEHNSAWVEPEQQQKAGQLAHRCAALIEVAKLEELAAKQGWGIGDDIESILRKMQELYQKLRDVLPDLARKLVEKMELIAGRIDGLKKSGVVDIAGREMEMAILLTQVGRARISEAVLKDQMESIRERNEKIRLLNIILGKIHERAGKENEVSLKDLTVQIGNSLIPVAYLLKELAVFSGAEYQDWEKNPDRKFNVNALCSKQIQAAIDDFNHDQQTDMNRMQSLASKRNEAYETLTNFVRKMDESMSKIIDHLG